MLGTLFASQGFNTVVNAIIAASPTITNTPNVYSPTGTYTLSASDFGSDGTTTWFGAMAYVNYLNSINYAGSNQWYLPTVANTTVGYNTATNGTAKGDELVELYYQELGSKAYPVGYGIVDPDNKFINEQSYAYWSGTEYAPGSNSAWNFRTNSGLLSGLQLGSRKSVRFYAWAVNPGQIASITPVPEAESTALLLVGLGVAAGVVRRRQSA